MSGSDVHIARGRHDDIPFPIALGHEIVGRVSGGDGGLVAIDPVAENWRPVLVDLLLRADANDAWHCLKRIDQLVEEEPSR